MPHSTTLHQATPHSTILHHATPRHATPYHTTQYRTTPHHTTPCHATQHHTTPCQATQHHTTPHSTILHTTPCHTAPHLAMPRYTTSCHGTSRHAMPCHTKPSYSTPCHATPYHTTTSLYHTINIEPHHMPCYVPTVHTMCTIPHNNITHHSTLPLGFWSCYWHIRSKSQPSVILAPCLRSHNNALLSIPQKQSCPQVHQLLQSKNKGLFLICSYGTWGM